MNATRKTLVIALIFVFALVAVLPAFQAPGLAATCQATYTVKRGDTLSRIGQKWGVAWREIAAANSIKAPWRIYTGSRLCIPTAGTTTPVTPRPPRTGRIPTFSISAVVRNSSVTIQTANFPANTKFDVRMGAFGTAGVGGALVTTIDSGNGGSFSATYSIPASLQGSRRIAIRLESPTTRYFAYNWFWNSNAQ